MLIWFQQSGGDLKGLEKELDALNQRDATLKAAISSTQDKIVTEQRTLKTLQKNIKIDEAALVKKEGEMAKVKQTFMFKCLIKLMLKIYSSRFIVWRCL